LIVFMNLSILLIFVACTNFIWLFVIIKKGHPKCEVRNVPSSSINLLYTLRNIERILLIKLILWKNMTYIIQLRMMV
jgi:hypothetical protein